MADVIRMDENTWRLEDGFVRFFLLEGKDKAAMIDSGANCPEAAELAKSARPAALWLTHYSPSMMHPEWYLKKIRKIFPETELGEDGKYTELFFEE